MANLNANNAVNGTDVSVVTPSNIGRGIKWDANTKKYEVNIGEGLIITEDGKVDVKKVNANPVPSDIIDPVNGKVIGNQLTIDYGNGLIEVNGIIRFPLKTTPNISSEEAFSQTDGRFYMGCSVEPVTYLSAADNGYNNLYHKESGTNISASELGMSKILSVNAIACDLAGYRTETPWLINDSAVSDSIKLGVHSIAFLAQDSIPVMFQVKGTKA